MNYECLQSRTNDIYILEQNSAEYLDGIELSSETNCNAAMEKKAMPLDQGADVGDGFVLYLIAERV
jgi:hypothetical protein